MYSINVKGSKINLSDIYKSKILSDIELNANDGGKIMAHKLILSIRSEYFLKLFAGSFKPVGSSIQLDVSTKILNLYLQLIYESETVVDNWKDLIRLFKFLDITSTNIIDFQTIMDRINVPTEEYSEFLNAIIELYHNELPISIIKLIENFAPNSLNYNDLGEEFTRLLIKTRYDDNTKYLIAHKAVQDGLNPSLYRLIWGDNLTVGKIDPMAETYFKYRDVLTDDIQANIKNNLPFRAIITRNNAIVYNGKRIILLRGKKQNYEMSAFMKGDDSIQKGDVIRVTKYYTTPNGVHERSFNIIDYEIMEY